MTAVCEIKGPALYLRAMRQFARDEGGSTAIEFSFLALPFFGTILAGLAIVYIQLASAELDAAGQVAGRAVMTGQATSAAQLQSVICAEIGGLVPCDQVSISLTPYGSLAAANTSNPTLTYNADGSVSNAFAQNFGGVGSIMVLQLIYQLPLVTGPLASFATQANGTHLLVATQVFVNE